MSVATAPAPAGAITTATLGVDMRALLDQLNEVIELEQLATDVYGSTARRLPEMAMQAKALEFRAGAERGRDAARALVRMLGKQPAPAKQSLAGTLGRARGALSAGRSGRLGALKNLQDMLLAAFLTAEAWTLVQQAAYAIGDPRLIETAEQEAGLKSMPLQWLLQTVAERSPWAILTPS